MLALLLALAPAADETPFVAVGADGERVVGKLVRLSPDFTATLATRTGDATVRGVISLRRENMPLPPFPTGPLIITAGGDRIAGTLLGGSGDSLRFAPSALAAKKEQAWVVPLSALSVVWIADTSADTPPDPARYAWTEGNKNRDVLRFRNGDTPRGVLVGITADGPTLQFRPDGGEARDIPGKEVAAVAFNPVLVRQRKPKGPFARLVLADGSRLALTGISIAGGFVKGETLFGRAAELPLDVVVGLDVLQGKAVYLSDLKPKKVEQAGFLGAGWPWAADRTVNGTQLRLAGPGGESTFDKGLGTHPRTVLTYDLGGKYRRFEALVGLDPETGDRGRAVVRVRVDGKVQVVPGLGSLTAGKPVAVRVDVTGAKELVLEVDFGPAGGVRSVVNWADARVVE